MACLRRLSLLSKHSFAPCRCLSQSPILSAKPNKKKQKRVLEKCNTFLDRKMTYNTNKKKTQWYNTPTGISNAGRFGTLKKGPTPGARRRAHQLSVVLSQYVISLINNGELDPRLPDLGVDIIRVKLIPDLGALHVYWMASGTSDDVTIQEILKETCHKLRTMLTGLHVMNYLPPVVFIKDLSQMRLQEVEALLERADMGPHHEPTELGADLKSGIALPFPSDQGDLSPISLQGKMDVIGDKLMEIHFDDGEKNTLQQGGDGGDFKEDLDDFGVNLRADIYDLDHSALTEKVFQIKRRWVARGVQPTAADIDGSLKFNPSQKVMADLSKQDIDKFLAATKYAKKRERPEKYLDSRLYRDVEDYGEELLEDDVDDVDDDDDNYKQ